MVITVGPDLETALRQHAQQEGVAPEALALRVLHDKLIGLAATIQPQDEWERRLLGLARDCGVSLSGAALSREGMYE